MKLFILLGVFCSAACVFAYSYDKEHEYKLDPPSYEPEPPKVYEKEPVKVYEPDYKPEPPKDYKPEPPPFNPYSYLGQSNYAVPAVPDYEAPAPPQVPAYGWPYGPYFPYQLLAGANSGNIGSVAESPILAPTVNRPATSPLRPGVALAGPGADFIFEGNGAAESQGVGIGGFEGTGVAKFNGQFPAGVFGGVDQAPFDGFGRINVFSNQGRPVGTFQNFPGHADFAGTGFTADQVAFIHSTVAGAGQGVGNIAGDGRTIIGPRIGRSYNLAPSYGYRSYGSGRYGGYGGYGYRSASPALYSLNRPRYYNAPRFYGY